MYATVQKSLLSEILGTSNIYYFRNKYEGRSVEYQQKYSFHVEAHVSYFSSQETPLLCVFLQQILFAAAIRNMSSPLCKPQKNNVCHDFILHCSEGRYVMFMKVSRLLLNI